MLFRKNQISAANIFKRASGEQVLIQLQPDSLGQCTPQGFLVAEPLVYRRSAGAGFARNRAQRQASLTAGAPQLVRGLQNSFLQELIGVGRHEVTSPVYLHL